MTSAKFDQYRSWSMLTSKPVMFYDDEKKDYYVYWFGISMHYLVCIALAGNIFANIHITKSMSNSLIENAKIDRSDLNFDELRFHILEALEHKKDNVTGKELLGWFDMRNLKVQHQE